ncbi:hypothetical protein K2Z83_21125 [Oscillochloris sp. ZM17-4]|uniref:hypothetical protein n=1 Tax=Oscillochloris sp. ZM17-4 TaxID=2866714 RepID=UPI001C73A1E8|nr:hypothetical protein [Oscillochloris sp. ZM17-4]
MGLGILLIPDLTRQAGDHIQQSGHPPGEHPALVIAQQPRFVQQRVQGRAIHRDGGREVILCPLQRRWQRARAGLPAGRHQRQNLVQHPLEQAGGQAAEALFDGLLRDLAFVDPQQSLAIEGADGFGDRPKLTPDQAQHERHHHRQVQGPFAQPQGMEVGDLIQGCRMDDVLQPLFDDHVGCRRVRALGTVTLDRPRMPYTALLRFFVAHASSLATRMRVSNDDSDISICWYVDI